MSIESHCPTMIIKDPHLRKERKDGYRFGACIDGSEQSYETFDFIKKVMSPDDKVTVICCEQDTIDMDALRNDIFEKLEAKDMHENAMIVMLD